MLAVLEDAIGCFQNFVCKMDNRQKKWFLEGGMVEGTGKGVDILLRKYQ